MLDFFLNISLFVTHIWYTILDSKMGNSVWRQMRTGLPNFLLKRKVGLNSKSCFLIEFWVLDMYLVQGRLYVAIDFDFWLG